jgi:phage host-nuclease inhibitor protein Gam
MGFLDKVKDAAGKAAEQAKHVTAVAQEKIDDTKLLKRVSDLYEEVGRLVVAQKRGNVADDYEAQLDARVAEITELEGQIDANNVDGAPPATADASSAPPPPPPGA